MQTNTKIWVVFPKGLDGCPIVLSISGDEARHVRPDERNMYASTKIRITNMATQEGDSNVHLVALCRQESRIMGDV